MMGASKRSETEQNVGNACSKLKLAARCLTSYI